MRITTQGEYGLRCLMTIAARQKHGPVSISEITKIEKLPKAYVEQLLYKLKKSGIVKSVRGIKGGYVLARHPSEIKLDEVIKALEKDTFEIFCDRENKTIPDCIHEGDCKLRKVWENLKECVDKVLGSTSILDII